MTKEAKITNISMNGYYSSTPATINIQVMVGDNYTTFALKGEEAQQMLALAWQLIEKKKHEMAEAMLNIQTPLLITAGAKLIEASDEDKIPF